MPQRYDRVAVTLHWAVALLVIAQFATGWIWDVFERGSEPRMWLFRAHIAMGSTILALALVRIGWRLTHRAPALPAMAAPLKLASRLTHVLLYAAIVVQPVLGLLAITAFGKSLGRWPRDFHMVLVWAIFALVALHVAAALWHHFIRRDGLLLRMMPARASSGRTA